MDKNVVNKLSDILEPTEEQKEQMFIKILDKHKNKSITKRGFRPMGQLRPSLVAALMIFFLFTTTSFAAAYLGLDIKLLNFLNPANEEQAEHLASGAYVIDKQVKNKNGILEVKQVIGDSNLTYILIDFTAPEGVVLNADRYRFDCSVDVDTYNDSYGIGFTKLEDENPEDNKISMIMELQTEKSLQGGTLKLQMKALEAAAFLPKTFQEATTIDEEEITFKTVLQGNWGTSFKLDFKDSSKTYTPNSKMTVYGYEATLQSISISPISVTVKMASPYTKEIHEAKGFEQVEYNTYLDSFPVTIHYKDGSKETTAYLSGMALGDYLSNVTTSIKTFEKMINDKEIQSIELFDTVVMTD